MVEPAGGWSKASWDALIAEADAGRRGQGAVVEANRRVVRSSTLLGYVLVVLTLVQATAAFLTILQWWRE